MTENKRLKILIKQLGFDTQKEFAEKINMKQGSLSDILREKPGVGVSNYVLDKLESLFFINKEWVKTGAGEMFRSDININIRPSESNLERDKPKLRLEAIPIRLADPFGHDATGDKIYELADGSLMMEVPIIPIRAQAGYVHNYQYPEFYEELATIPVMINKKAFSTYMAFEVQGDSMVNLSSYEMAEKSIFEGRVAVGRLLDKSKWTSRLHTHTYNSWIIVHREKGIVCKEIIDHDVENGLITIHSLNPNYKDEVWSLEDIDQIFSIVKIDQNKR